MVVAQYSLGAYPAPRPASLHFFGTSYRFYRGCILPTMVGFKEVYSITLGYSFWCKHRI